MSSVTYALLGGIIPALVWLFFWLREDYKNPEPRGLILKTFIFGMIAVVVVLPFQKFVDIIIPGAGFIAILIWVTLEELFKFLGAYFGGLHTVEDNEPIDPIIYMITASLGFVAVENALFLFSSLVDQSIVTSVVTGNLRFVGASLLHVVSSGMIGVALALSFYKPQITQIKFISIGVALAVIFHTGFNSSIVYWGNPGTLLAFGLVWISVVFLLLAFEKSKTIARDEAERYN